MYENFQTIIIIIAAIALFVFALQSFSKEIDNLGTERLAKWMSKITNLPLGGFLTGGIFTAIVQSSTLVSTLTVSLVNAGIITFRDSIMILLGTNIGTTSTAWIVSINSDFIGPFFIVLGSLMSIFPSRIAIAGKSVFFFGFIFFSLAFIGDAMEPIKNNAYLIEVLSKAANPLLGIIYGIIITVIIQSSSVVIGLVIVLLAQGTIGIEASIPIVVGANIGTTSTALLVSLKYSSIAKLVAWAASAFNIIGVLIMFPFFGTLQNIAVSFSAVPSLQVAMAYTLSNTFTSIFFLLLIEPTLKWLQSHRWYKPDFTEDVKKVEPH